MDKIKGFMDTGVSTKNISKTVPISINWQDNSAIQGLLDVVVSVMADEYIQIAQENKKVFMDPPVPSALLRTGKPEDDNTKER